MTTTVSKGRLYSVTVEVSDERLRAMRDAPELAEKGLMAGADFWHTGILPRHFQRSAHSTYDYADRTKKYKRRKRGAPDLVNTGAMAAELMGRAAFQRVGKAVNLKMYARALNFAPSMPANSSDHYVMHGSRRGRRGAKYPNMKREIRAFTEAEREQVAEAIAQRLESLFDPADPLSKSARMIAA